MISGGVLLGFAGSGGGGVPAATQFPRAARPAVGAVLPMTSPAPRRQDSQLNPRERVQGWQEACDSTPPLWLSAPPAKGQTRGPLRAVGAGRAGAPGLGSRGAVSLRGPELAAPAEAGSRRGAAVSLLSAEKFPLGPGFRHHGNCWGWKQSSSEF